MLKNYSKLNHYFQPLIESNPTSFFSLFPGGAWSVALVRLIRSKEGGTVYMDDSKLHDNYAKAEALYDAGDFGPMPKTTDDDALLSCLETYAIAPK